jgi:hypothetical protein
VPYELERIAALASCSFSVDGFAALCHHRKNLFGAAAQAGTRQIAEKLQ